MAILALVDCGIDGSDAPDWLIHCFTDIGCHLSTYVADRRRYPRSDKLSHYWGNTTADERQPMEGRPVTSHATFVERLVCGWRQKEREWQTERERGGGGLSARRLREGRDVGRGPRPGHSEFTRSGEKRGSGVRTREGRQPETENISHSNDCDTVWN